MLIGWKLTSFPCYLYRFAITTNLTEGCQHVLGCEIWQKYQCSQRQMNKLFHRRNFGSPVAYTSLLDSTQLNLDFAGLQTVSDSSCLVFVCHVIVRFGVLHNISTVHWIISPTTTIRNSHVSMHQITRCCWASFKVVAAIQTIVLLNFPRFVTCFVGSAILHISTFNLIHSSSSTNKY